VNDEMWEGEMVAADYIRGIEASDDGEIEC
jgi:hypothetical protein